MRILIIGCGDIGLRVAQLLKGRVRFLALTRSPASHEQLRAAGVTPILGDLDDRHSLRRLGAWANRVLHFAPPPGEGNGDPRTRRLLAALRAGGILALHHASSRGRVDRADGVKMNADGLVYISTSGVYGDCGGAEVAETYPAHPGNMRALRRADAEAQLRRYGRGGRRVCILRAPGIYAQNRMPSERVKKGLPALRAEEDVYTNHIHADDLARLALAALFRGRANRLYNAVDDSGLKMGDWFDVVADHLALPRPPRLSRREVTAAVTPAMRSFLSESRRLSNRRIKKELRFRLKYRTVREGLK